MLKTVKNGSGIREETPPPLFFKIPTFSRFFWGGASLIVLPDYMRSILHYSRNPTVSSLFMGFKRFSRKDLPLKIFFECI